MKCSPAVALASVLMLSLTATAQSPRRAGNWEITVDVEIGGLTAPIPSRTVTQCVTSEDAAASRNALPRHDASTLSGCAASDHTVDGGRVTWSFKCEHPKPVTGSGEIIYTGDTAYRGTITLVSEGQSMTMKYAGRRLGDCEK